jgi:tetratricopeptide (TPR) repeat protein
LESLRSRLEFPILKPSEIEKIHQASGGSPLFTESLLRLLRWNTVSEAIAGWKGERGAAVRAAALRREIQLLSAEGQRILFAIAMLGEISKVELCEVLGYTSEVVENGLNALQSLFLVAAPSLAEIPRFRVPDNTRRLVLDPTIQLVTDRVRLQKEIEDFRRKDDRTPTRDLRIASAISQAESLSRVGNSEAAMATIKEALRKTKDHQDLLCYQANLFLKKNPPGFEEARLLARKAFQKGCRKVELFQCWFEAEWLAKHYIGALEAAEAALTHKSPSVQEWLIRKSAALASKAADQSKAGSAGAAISTMFEASEALRDAIVKTKRDDSLEWEERQESLHDQIWYWSGLEGRGLGKTDSQINALEKMWRYGDTRITNLRRMLSAIESMSLAFERKVNKITVSQKNLYLSLLSRGQTLFNQRQQRFSTDKRHDELRSNWNTLDTRARDAINGIIIEMENA